MRIKTRRGFDWTGRFPLIIEAAERLRATSFVLDGEGVILRPDCVSDFDRLHSRRHDGEVQLLGFDLLELDGTVCVASRWRAQGNAGEPAVSRIGATIAAALADAVRARR